MNRRPIDVRDIVFAAARINDKAFRCLQVRNLNPNDGDAISNTPVTKSHKLMFNLREYLLPTGRAGRIYSTMVRIEGLAKSQHYRAVIHYGEAYAPIAEADINSLGQCLELSVDDFLNALPEKVTGNRYLQDRIREAIATIDDRTSLMNTLKDSVRTLAASR